MNQSKTVTYDIQGVPAVAQQLVALMGQVAVFTFTGPLGAGKTTLIAQMLAQCGIIGPITSPTFTYLNCYKNASGQHFYHFDLYRIDGLDQFLAAGFEEFLYQPKSWAFIEWPAPIESILTDRVCRVQLDWSPDGNRIAQIFW